MKFEQLTHLVAKAIKKGRVSAGLTQEQLAEKAGFNYKFYQRIEAGTSNVTLKTISKVSQALRVHPKTFFK